MAINTQRISLIEQARARRITLPRYFKLDGSRYLLGLVVILCLMSLIALAQTGVVATKGYEIANLQAEHTQLMRERSQLLARQAQATNLEQIRRRAAQIGLRPMTDEQVRYVYITPPAVPPDELAGDTGQ
jgi:hypothetical protein